MVGGGRVGGLEDVSINKQTTRSTVLTDCRFELGVGWFGNYDGYDLASLSLLSHGPPVSCSVCACRVNSNAI